MFNDTTVSNRNNKLLNQLLIDKILTKEPDHESILYKSRDYNLLNGGIYNRPLKEKHLKTLTKLIEEYGFNPALPIIVNELLQILDGHHRYFVAAQLKVPYYYMITKHSFERIQGWAHWC